MGAMLFAHGLIQDREVGFGGTPRSAGRDSLVPQWGILP